MSHSKNLIKIVFKSEDGREYDTYTKALISSVITQNTYLDSYKLEIIVSILADNFYIKEKKVEKKEENETI